MRTSSLALGLFFAGSLLAGAAGATAPVQGAAPAQLELRDGSEGRARPDLTARPRRASRALLQLDADVGARVSGLFDARTRVPSRLWGFSVPAPGATTSEEIATKVAQDAIGRHVALLAPGSRESDFEQTVNHLDMVAGGLRTVGFQQKWRGMPVLGGFVSVRIKNDRLFGLASDAFPSVHAKIPDAWVAEDVAIAAARDWVLETSALARTTLVDGPFVLPIARGDGFDFVVVMRVQVQAKQPVGLFDVFVDAGTGVPVARTQLLKFESARLEIGAWTRSPSYGDRESYAAANVPMSIEDGTNASGESASDGAFSFDGVEASGTATLDGTRVRVRSDDGANVSLSFDAGAGDVLLWSEESETADSQLNAFVHAGLVNEYARSFAPDLDFLDEQVIVTVNIEDVCNAFSDGTSINFFKSGSGCENTGRIADVVYHEYGHSLHYHAYLGCQGVPNCGPDGSLGEGQADYLAATMTGDPEMGRGFFMDDGPLRSVDPEGGEHVWPFDVVGEVHYDGLIIGGALWDMRKLLVEEYGEEDGVALANRLYYAGIRRALNIPTMVPEMLFADDDDGDLANGTPNECLINDAMGRHGLRAISGLVAAPSLAPPQQDGYDVSLQVEGLSAHCGEALSGAYMVWSDESDPTRGGSIDMSEGADGVARGKLPAQPAGHTIRFDVRVDAPSIQLSYPANPADPSYQLYVGEVTPIFCTDFEIDPFTQGWSHELITGDASREGADDWMWGEPNGSLANGDPENAFGGFYAVGQDFSPEDQWNGHYQAEIHSALISPPIAVAGFDQVRLQYRRWLNVEDGFFDHATVLANGTRVWSNFDSGEEGAVHHTDKEWRFHDVDLTAQVAEGGGNLQLRWELESDGGVEMGGWTIDDVCVVGVHTTDGECTTGPCGPDTTATTTTGGGTGEGGGDDGEGADPDADDGCGCATPGTDRRPSAPLAALAAAIGLLLAARRRRVRG